MGGIPSRARPGLRAVPLEHEGQVSEVRSVKWSDEKRSMALVDKRWLQPSHQALQGSMNRRIRRNAFDVTGKPGAWGQRSDELCVVDHGSQLRGWLAGCDQTAGEPQFSKAAQNPGDVRNRPTNLGLRRSEPHSS